MITKDEMLEGLRQAVQERGEEYVDPRALDDSGCLYVLNRGLEDAQPGCIVGTAYYFITGKLLDEKYELKPAVDILELSNEAATIASVAQGKQDSGHTWGRALRAAEIHAEQI